MLGGARLLGENINPGVSEFLVREIVAYNATKIFHAPVRWPDENDDSWVRIQGETPDYSATLTGELKTYLENESNLGQYAIDPGLREMVGTIEKQSGSDSTYLVVEERGPITDCRMDQGECWLGPNNGKDGVVFFKAIGGAWPTFNEQAERDLALLAAMRTMTKVTHPFELHVRSVCFITDKGEPAHSMVMEMNVAYGGARVIKQIPGGSVVEWADQLADNAERLRRASTDPAVHELLAAIRFDKTGEEEYFRLWYLRLWQALVDVGLYCEQEKVRNHLEVLKEQQRWKDLSKHRTAIAHWSTDIVDYEKVQDLHRFAVEVADYITTASRA